VKWRGRKATTRVRMTAQRQLAGRSVLAQGANYSNLDCSENDNIILHSGDKIHFSEYRKPSAPPGNSPGTSSTVTFLRG
jgi:hypothetical protein